MPGEVSQIDRYGEAVSRLDQLRRFTGAEKIFWSSFLASAAGVTGARFATLLRAGPAETPGWQRLAAWPAEGLPEPIAKRFLQSSGDLAEACVQHGAARLGWEAAAGAVHADWCLGLHLPVEDEPEAHVATFLLENVSEAGAEERLRRLRLLAYLPAAFRLRKQANHSETALAHFASVLDLTALLSVPKRFLATAMTLCNELAARHECERVSLGWLEGDYVKVKAISHSERFDRKMEVVQQIEAAMEEALDQEEAVTWPETADQRLVTREHARLAEAQKVKRLCSVPLRVEGTVHAVVTCERNDRSFTEVEVRLLSLCVEMAERRLGDLHRTDRWWGARWARAGREAAGRLVGPEHTGAKLLAAALAVALAIAIFGKMDYRVDAPFYLRTEDAIYRSAPFNGYLDEVKVDIGDAVKQGDVLATLDTRDLLLEEAGAVADQTRYLREAEKASAADKPAEMRIAQAQAEQAKAKLEIIRFRRQQSSIVAPFNGVVVEGDLKKRLAAPLKQGEVLFKIARIDHLYIECSVNERDIHEIHAGGTGEIAFSSSPEMKFPIHIQRIEPASQTADAANVFLVRCTVEGPPHPWWRPGMSGIAKLSVARRSYLWVLTHRTLDFVRMRLWW